MRYTIGQLAEIIDGDRGKNYPKQNEFFENGHCLFLNTGNVTIEGFSFECNLFISKEKDSALRKGKLQRGDIVYTTRGTVGNAAFFNNNIPYEHLRINSGMVILRCNEYVCNPRFLYQILKSNYYRPYFKKYCTGSAQPQLPIKNLSKIELNIPNLKLQDRIADILFTYDDLIENNQKQIKLLEEAAQRLYKEWFVDLHFSGYENASSVDGIPDGWKKVQLKEIIDYEIGGGWGNETPTKDYDSPAFVIRGTDLFGLTHGDFAEIPYRFHENGNLSGRKLIDGDIIFEVSGGSKTEGVARTALIRQSFLNTLGSPAMCASFCKLIRVERVEYSQYLYDTLQYLRRSGKTVEFDKRSASSIVNYRWKDFLQQQEILLPEQSVLVQYNKIAENIYRKILNCSIQILQTKKVRARLLPRLMSGDLEV